MKRIAERSRRFRRDLKQALKGRYRDIVAEGGELDNVVDALALGLPLPEKYHDHALHNNWEGYRECHIRPDLLLVYAYIDDDVLRLESLGSHSEILGL
ncbi:MAG: type II toxin-antitoxin system YafQ family toxin [Synergistaceae bacterium]|nr:type II toxin-antitoxin system YafQ family toxin [Synergistaceae bacterium]MBQ7168337.1 type II toxin-antitoxin system YafQ family toxin [Synergistaceae bacterium]